MNSDVNNKKNKRIGTIEFLSLYFKTLRLNVTCRTWPENRKVMTEPKEIENASRREHIEDMQKAILQAWWMRLTEICLVRQLN